MAQLAYFQTSDAETMALDQWIAARRAESINGQSGLYFVLGRSCRDYCLAGLAEGGALTSPGYFFYSAVPNTLILELMRIAAGSYDSGKKEREPLEQPNVTTSICYADPKTCAARSGAP